MFRKVTFLILLTRFPYKTSASSVCVPNSQSLLNGKICKCSSTGHWADAGCYEIARRQICTPGKVVFQGCSRCICQDSGQLACTENTSCTGPLLYQNVHETLATVLPWCSPFRTYYISCNICICPASGKTSEAHCALDISCTFFREPSTSEMASKKNTCIPKVMYLFPCLHCLCSENGYFNLEKCVETCVRKPSETTRRCIPKTIYRKDCNICLCPENSIPDNKHCTNATCTHPTSFGMLRHLKNKQTKCTPHAFTKSRCMYCDCSHDGDIDEKSCLEHECLQSADVKYDSIRETCSPGELVSFCMECLCPRNGITSGEHCSKACSYQSKLNVLEKILNRPDHKNIIDKESIKRGTAIDLCKPDTIYFEHGRYCLCPDTGNSNFNLCTSSPDKKIVNISNKTDVVAIDFNVTCEPSTFVEFDCNTCFCSKKGKIDPKWCTYDDCETKRIVQESHVVNPIISPSEPISNSCNPGSISNVGCNFCICPSSGSMQERICTKNDCSGFEDPLPNHDKFACDPLTYFEVDCNICFCPRDGIKNVGKCTKNHCEKSYLRSDVCVPGQLFSDGCDVCVCPPNGNKAERACTNYTCTDSVPWKKIFQLSESLLGNQISEDATRNLDLCFPGEEFVTGCKLCVCPEMGLRFYATCSPTFCEEETHSEGVELGSNRDISLHRKLNTRREDCMMINYTNNLKRDKCTPGSMYIVRCKQCICPYMGDMSYFCRPLPEDFYCEQAYPGYNYLPMGRRTDEENSTDSNPKTLNSSSTVKDKQVDDKNYNKTSVTNSTTASAHSLLVQHEHTRYECKKRGKIKDECFVCECDGETLIAEHCYQSNSTQCVQATPSFLQDYVKPTKPDKGSTKKP